MMLFVLVQAFMLLCAVTWIWGALASPRSAFDLEHLQRRRLLGAALFVAPVIPLGFLASDTELHTMTWSMIGVLALILANYNAVMFVPLGCPGCKGRLHRSW